MVRKVKKLWPTRHQGSAALITTVAISMVLVILFVGITTIATREIRQSISNDNANRALYGAEAGVEDAVRRLANDPKVIEPSCNSLTDGQEVPVSGSGDTADISWTCRTINQYLSSLIGRVSTDESIQINTAKALDGPDPATATSATVAYMKIEWNKPTVDASTPVVVGSAKSASFLPPYLQGYNTADTTLWQGRAAALEVTATWLPNTINAAALSNLSGVAPIRTVLASPAGISTSPGTAPDGSPWNGGNGCAAGTQRNNQSCMPSVLQYAGSFTPSAGQLASDLDVTCRNGVADYSCQAPASNSGFYDVTKLMNTEYETNVDGNGNPVYTRPAVCTNLGAGANGCVMVLRIKARYAPASYRITFYDAGRNPLYMSDGQATIDVTARSGTYYRRVVAKKQLVPKAFDNVFDSALFSGTDICKTMRIYKDYRGAPDFTQTQDAITGVITRNDNPDAGKNTNGSCVEG